MKPVNVKKMRDVRITFLPQHGKESDLIKIYGYVRVSSRDQNEDRQLDALQTLVVMKNIYMTNSRERILKDLSIKGWYEN